MDLKVIKKGGQQEPFIRDKVKGSVVKAGGTEEQGQSIASQVESWANENSPEGTVISSDIRVKVIELLKSANPEAAAKFEAYKKPAE